MNKKKFDLNGDGDSFFDRLKNDPEFRKLFPNEFKNLKKLELQLIIFTMISVFSLLILYFVMHSSNGD